jgi:hypothetical protein
MHHTTALAAEHIAAVTTEDAVSGGKHPRPGGRNGALQWHRESDDAAPLTTSGDRTARRQGISHIPRRAQSATPTSKPFEVDLV